MSSYYINMEIEGLYALWTDPASGSSPCSYPAPTYSAIKNIFESILFVKSAEVCPYRVDICKPLQYDTIVFNSRGPYRKKKWIKEGNAGQVTMNVLYDVCYRFYARVYRDPKYFWKTNSPHEYKDRFNKRMALGQKYQMPFLGVRSFLPSYFGPFRPETKLESTINITIPSMFKSMFPDGKNTDPRPIFWGKEMKIKKGVLIYA